MKFEIVIAQAFLFCVCQSIDLTTVPETAGIDVVFASVSRIQQANIFLDDNRLLRRVAFAETRDGIDLDTYREGYNGGIWQVDESIFDETQNSANHPELTDIYNRVLGAFGVNWTAEVQWIDLRRPFFSALAARIYFEIVEEDIPNIGDLEGQGQFWKRHFNSNPQDTVQTFVNDVDALELEECPARGIDLSFVFDSSGSVGQRNFELEKDFAINVTRTFSIGPLDTQIAAVAYSGFARISFLLDTFNNQSSIIRALGAIEYFDIPGNGRPSTNTADALIRTRQEIFTPSGGARDTALGYPRITVVITDGRSNVNRSLTVPSAEALHDNGVTVFAVGVGRRIDMDELNSIASSENFVILLSQFNLMEFVGLQRRISAEACIIPAVIPIEQPIESTIDAGEFIFFQFQLPPNGMTIQLQQQRGSVTLYGSFDVQNPNSAFHSFRIESSGDMYVPLGDSGQSSTTDEGLSKRLVKRIAENETRTLYVSIEGEQDFSSFILETTFGNTSGAPTNQLSVGLFLLLILIILVMI